MSLDLYVIPAEWPCFYSSIRDLYLNFETLLNVIKCALASDPNFLWKLRP
jgi:hypothetical protein